MDSEITSSNHANADVKCSRFIIWVDGVGGFLACTQNENSIGQAVPNAKAAIPITGDIHEMHARIESIDGGHLLHPIGPVSMLEQSLRSPVALVHDRTFELGESVSLRYRKPHAYSTTAIIDFESRHRTYPWSDAVLLAGNTIVLGPSRSNHIFCPNWRNDVILVRRQGQWFCKCKGPIEIDDDCVTGEGRLGVASRVEGADFSFSLEPIE